MVFLRRVVLVSLLTALAVSAHAATAKAKSKPAADTGAYKGAIVIDAADGRVLFEHNADVITPPASMAKLMTFAVLSDKLAAKSIQLDSPVKITKEDAKMGGTQVYLDSRETFTVEELIYAMMIQSANDAAHALARFSGGSVEAFVESMNAKAHEIGMKNTIYRTPHGLFVTKGRTDDGDLTTPRDYALLCRYLVTHTDVLHYSSVMKRDFAPDREFGETQHMKNHNNLLGKVPGVDGLKTGYTEGAGYCLSATAIRNEHRIITVIMGAFGPGGKIDLGVARDRFATEMIEHAFSNLPPDSPKFSNGTPTLAAAPPPPTDPKAPAPSDAVPQITVKPLPKRK